MTLFTIDPSTSSSTTVSTNDVRAQAREALRSLIRGQVISPTDPEFEVGRKIASFLYDRRPAAIVRVANTLDVAIAVRTACAFNLPLAVRSGGHSVAGHSSIEGEIVIDLGNLDGINIDPVSRTAVVQAAVRSQALGDQAAQYGLAISTGDTGSVGLGGLAAGGGIGWMVRQQGLTVDNILAATVVTAEGEVIRASATEHADLFWAIRGGGGNFGIVTEFELRLTYVGLVQAGALVLPATPEVIRGYIDYTPEATEDLTTIAFMMAAPPAPFIPPDRVGEVVVLIGAVYTGDPAKRDEALAPLRALGTPIVDTIDEVPYPTIFAYTDEATKRHGASIRSLFTDDLTDEQIEATIEAMHRSTSPFTMIQFRGLGGAMSRVPADATAFVHRDRRLMVSPIAIWMDETDDPAPHQQWTAEIWEKLVPASKGVYVNFLEDEGEERKRHAYAEVTFQRLAEVKRQYDPSNVFRFNQNIAPAR